MPEDRSRPSGRAIDLNVVVVPASGERTLPPLFDFAGGPGIAATESADFWLTDGAIHRRHRDIVLVDQRGTGKSALLGCPEVKLGDPRSPPLDAAAVAQCRARLAKDHDLSRYSTAEAVADADDVRAALGHEKIDISGLSYGTRVAQEYLRLHPDRVRAAVLLGSLAPDVKLPLTFAKTARATLDEVLRQCAADPGCPRVDLAAVDAALPKAGLSAGPFWEAARALLVDTASQRHLPLLLHRAAQGDFAPILEALSRPPEGSNALLLAVSCPEDTLRITKQERDESAAPPFGTYRLDRQIAACEAWGVAPAKAAHQFATAKVPVLLLAGEMDHVTPPGSAERIAAHLPGAKIVRIPSLGHFPIGVAHMECYDQMIAQFFETGAVDSRCVASMQPPPFAR